MLPSWYVRRSVFYPERRPREPPKTHIARSRSSVRRAKRRTKGHGAVKWGIVGYNAVKLGKVGLSKPGGAPSEARRKGACVNKNI